MQPTLQPRLEVYAALRTPWHEDAITSFSTVNVVTCAAYLVAGAWLWADHWMAAAFVGLGLGSAVYHVTRAPWADRVDYAGIFFVLTYLVMRALGLPTWSAVVGATLLSAAPWWSVTWEGRVALVALLIGVALGRGDGWETLAAAGLLVVGYVSWNLDVAHRFPWPRWGHGVWHLCTAAGLALLHRGAGA